MNGSNELNESKLFNNDDWEIMDNPTELILTLVNKITDLSSEMKELKVQLCEIKHQFQTLNSEGLVLKNKIAELTEKHKQTYSFDWMPDKRKLSEKDLLKMDYLRSRNTCIRTKSTTGFLPDI